jgi:hypothetical protein
MVKAETNINRIGTIGLFITAIFSPCCFPLFGMGLTALGLGSFELFGEKTMYIFQGLTLLSLAGIVWSYLKHRSPYALITAVISVIIIFVSYYYIDEDYWIYLTYAGMVGMLIASVINYKSNKTVKSNKIQLRSIITCPECHHAKEETMPTNACTYFYECENCKTRLKAKEGDCCVYCSYGTVQCPPMQIGEGCC